MERIIKQKWIIIFLLLFSQVCFSQSDHEFWFVAPPVTHQYVSPSPILYQNLNQPIRIYFTTADGPATVTVDQPANPLFFPITRIVNNDSARMVDLTGFIDLVETKPANSILNTGLHITSDKEITAFYEVQSPHNAETWPMFGKNALGYEFIIPSQQHYSNYEYSDPPALNSFEIVATEDSTLVQILPRVPIVGHTTLDTISIMLNRGQTWNGSAVSGDSTSHLAGSFVFSNKPVAVTISDDAVYIPGTIANNSEDIAGAQLIPRQLCGTEFAFGAYFSATQREDIYIYAFEDATLIVYNDSLQIISRTINRGDSIDLRMSVGLLGRYCHIQSNKPIPVCHFFAPYAVYPPPFFALHPRLSLVIIPPLSCAGSRRVLYTRTPPRGEPNFFT